jgi:polyhydroxybutyrate depolymerase
MKRIASTPYVRAGMALAALAAVAAALVFTLQDYGADTRVRARPIVYVPPHLPAGRVPLLVALHGSGGSPAQMEATSGFDRLAQARGFIVAYLASGSPLDNWIVPADTTLVRSAIEHLEATEPIDRGRVYVTGFSAGGYESYRAGCLLGDTVAAIAPVGVSMNATLYETCKPSRPVSTLIIIGSADTGHYGGYGGLPSAPAAAARWRALDRCPAQPAIRSRAPGPTDEQLWSGCAGGSGVGLDVIRGGTHSWPAPALGRSSPDGRFDAAAAIWAFFAAHGRR